MMQVTTRKPFRIVLLLQVTFETAGEPDATTRATIVLELHGVEGIAGPLDFDNSQTPLERNSATSFAVEGRAVGDLEKLVVTLEALPVCLALAQHKNDVPWLQLGTVAAASLAGQLLRSTCKLGKQAVCIRGCQSYLIETHQSSCLICVKPWLWWD